MAEAYKASLLINGISPEDCYIKAVDSAVKAMPEFTLWKKRPVARLFGLQKKNDEFSTINFFLVTQTDGVEIQVRFNTKNVSIEELKNLFKAFQDDMLRSR